jgi:uncharacterized SAM-binding protein YcdF (DUF218 family)
MISTPGEVAGRCLLEIFSLIETGSPGSGARIILHAQRINLYMKRLTIILGLLAAAICLLVIVKYAGFFLVVDQAPKKADVIIVCSGTPSRSRLGISLYHQGYAPYIIFTGFNDRIKTAAIERGVPANAIILDQQARSTYGNAFYSRALMQQYGFKSALVVSSTYHMRRVKIIFSSMDKGYALTFTAAQDPGFNPALWWDSARSIRRVLREYAGILSYYLGLGPYITDDLITRSPVLRFLFD